MPELYYLDWVLMILNLYSYLLIGNKKRIGFLLGGIGCLIGLILFSTLVYNLPLLIMYISFGVLNILNYIKWSKQ